MRVRIVQAHPEPASYNGAMSQRAHEALEGAGHEVSLQDLVASGFDPVEAARHYPDRTEAETFAPLAEQRHGWKSGHLPADVRREIDALEWADLLILQFPLWWHGPPAILKGWFDRVFVSGGLYTSRMRYDTGYFRGKRALVSVTSGAPEAALGPGARGGDFETMLWPLQYSLHYLGFSVLRPFISHGVQGHGYTYEGADSLRLRLRHNLNEWAGYVLRADTLEPLTFPGWSDWDSDGRATAR
nr:NAD(P)H-dependent oxidoreductase [Marinicella sp. W31]MDC2875544.1 NAD(P)H-dependent oxidoreductase [Marinicella sp. W31]